MEDQLLHQFMESLPENLAQHTESSLLEHLVQNKVTFQLKIQMGFLISLQQIQPLSRVTKKNSFTDQGSMEHYRVARKSFLNFSG